MKPGRHRFIIALSDKFRACFACRFGDIMRVSIVTQLFGLKEVSTWRTFLFRVFYAKLTSGSAVWIILNHLMPVLDELTILTSRKNQTFTENICLHYIRGGAVFIFVLSLIGVFHSRIILYSRLWNRPNICGFFFFFKNCLV